MNQWVIVMIPKFFDISSIFVYGTFLSKEQAREYYDNWGIDPNIWTYTIERVIQPA